MRQEPRLSTPDASDLHAEIAALRREVKKLNEHRFIRVQNSLPRLMMFMLLRGLALGLGTVIGASVLVSIVAFALAQIDFLPIIGDWAADFAEQIESEVRSRQSDGQEGTAGSAGEDGSIRPSGSGGGGN